MLRLAVLVLLLANAGYYAWTQGALRSLGLGPVDQSEPERLLQQIHPEALRIERPAAEAAHPAAPAATEPASTAVVAEPGVCLQAGTFDTAQADALRRAAAVLPEGSWRIDPAPVASRWMVYMGKFPDDVLDKKRAELRALKVPYDRPGAALEPGLSLGRFASEESAQRALTTLTRQGVRSARVVQERPDATGYVLRLPAAAPALVTQAETQLRTALAGKPLRACPNGA